MIRGLGREACSVEMAGQGEGRGWPDQRM